MSECTKKPQKRKVAIDRPPKPYPDFPLGAANNGYGQKDHRQNSLFWPVGPGVDGKLQRL